jgi:phosphoglycerate dehydrogenase-like enzyme
MNPINVLVTMPFGEERLERMRAVSPRLNVTQAQSDTPDYSLVEVLYTWMPPRELNRAPHLKWVQLHLAGVDMLTVHPIYASAIPMTTTSGVHAASAAEYALTQILALAHRVPRMLGWQHQGSWPPDEQRWPIFVPSEVRGTTLGIIGYGSIGREVARLAKVFSMRVLALKRDPTCKADDGYHLPGTGDPDGSLPDAWFGPAGLLDLLRESDYVVLSAPLTRETKQWLGEAEFAAMKSGAFFVNVGRGATVNEGALARALADRRIAGAALDVFGTEPLPQDSPFYKLDNVILSPHVSGFIPSYDDKCTDLFVENLRRYVNGEPLLNVVDRAKGY